MSRIRFAAALALLVSLHASGAACAEPVEGPSLRQPDSDENERGWSTWLAIELEGHAEYPLPFRCRNALRVDVMTEQFAIEVDWCNPKKADEALKQAHIYGLATGRAPVALLLMDQSKDGSRVNDPKLEHQAYRTAILRGAKIEPPVRVVAVSVDRPDMERLRQLLGLAIIPTAVWGKR